MLVFSFMGMKNFQMSKLGLEKGEEQIANICWIIDKAREFQKNIYFCFINYTKALTECVGVGNCFLLQGIFATQGSNPGPPHCRQILYQIRYQGSPMNRVINCEKLLKRWEYQTIIPVS